MEIVKYYCRPAFHMAAIGCLGGFIQRVPAPGSCIRAHACLLSVQAAGILRRALPGLKGLCRKNRQVQLWHGTCSYQAVASRMRAAAVQIQVENAMNEHADAKSAFDSCKTDIRELLTWAPSALFYGAVNYLAIVLLS